MAEESKWTKPCEAGWQKGMDSDKCGPMSKWKERKMARGRVIAPTRRIHLSACVYRPDSCLYSGHDLETASSCLST